METTPSLNKNNTEIIVISLRSDEINKTNCYYRKFLLIHCLLEAKVKLTEMLSLTQEIPMFLRLNINIDLRFFREIKAENTI